MNPLERLMAASIFCLIAVSVVSTTAPAQETGGQRQSTSNDPSSNAEAVALQKKASAAQARIRENEADRGELKRAVKINEVGLAKEVLLRNGFTSNDLDNAKIILLTGGGKGGADEITISANCCDPKEITIQRTLENFTK